MTEALTHGSILDGTVGTRWRTAFMVLGFTILTALGAQARFPLPFTPVPLTLQTLAVMMAGYCLSPRAAFMSQAIYVVAGLAGLPFLAAAGTGTIGYLFGFVVAAPLVSLLVRHGHSAVAGLVGVAVVHVAGCAGLAVIGVPVGLPLFVAGSLPFLPGDVLKAAVAARMAGRSGLSA